MLCTLASTQVSSRSSSSCALGTMDPAEDCEVRRLSLGALFVLPDYLLNLILLHLETEDDLARLACTSRVLRVLCYEEPLWIWFCFKNHDGRISFQANWRQTALMQLRQRRQAQAQVQAQAQTQALPPNTHYGPVMGLSATNTTQVASATQTTVGKCPDDHAIAAAAQPPAPVPGLQSMFLYKRWCRRYMDVSGFVPPHLQQLPTAAGLAGSAGDYPCNGKPVDRVCVKGMSPQEFAQRFDDTCLPALLSGAMEGWPVGKWTFEAMVEQYGDVCFSVARPTSGQAPMLLRDYVDYMKRQADEEPLYIFDAEFVEAAPSMREAYEVPHVFDQDMLSLLGPMRPPYRWLVAGPARSGASWHVDPSLTSAWNALLHGRKRWLLYPPHVMPPGVSPGADDSLTSLQWLLEVYPLLVPEMRPIELLQEPGEVVWVPGGWWHAVLNLEPSVAVTQNFVSAANFKRSVRHMSHGSEHYHDLVDLYYDKQTRKGWGWRRVKRQSGMYKLSLPGGVPAADGEVKWASDSGSDSEEDESGCGSGSGDEAEPEEGGQEGHNQGDGAGCKRKAGQAMAARGQSARKQQRTACASTTAEPLAATTQTSAATAQQPWGLQPPSTGSTAAVGGSGAGGSSGGRCGGPVLAYVCGVPVLQPQVSVPGTYHGPDGDDAGPCGAAAMPQLLQRSSSGQGGGGNGRVGAGNGAAAACDNSANGAPQDLSLPPLVGRQLQRKKQLGVWLRKLWEQQPHMRPAIQECMQDFLSGNVWQRMLQAVCDALPAEAQALAFPGGPSACSGAGVERQGVGQGVDGLSLLPLVGASSLVFLVGGVAVKFITEEVPALAELMCSMEVVCPSLLNNMHAASRMQQAAGAQARQGSSSSAAAAEGCGVGVGVGVQTVPGCKVEADAGVRVAVAPQVLACGVVTVRPTEPRLDGVSGKVAHAREGTGAAQCQASEHGQQQQQQRQQRQQHQQQHQQQRIPFVVTRRVDPSAVPFNLALQSLGPEQRLDLAAQLGRQVAAMHLAGRPAAPWILRAGSADRTAATAAAAAAAAANVGVAVHASMATTSSAAGSWTGSANGLEAAEAKAEVPLPSGLQAWLQVLAPESVQLQPHVSSCAGDEGRGSGSGGAQAQGAAAGSWLWHNRHGSIWMSPESSEAASGHAAAAWKPFVEFLRSRRHMAAYDLEAQHALPLWLVTQVDTYLPADPASLLGFAPASPLTSDGGVAPKPSAAAHPATAGAAETAASGDHGSHTTEGEAWPELGAAPDGLGLPWLVHGDLLPANIQWCSKVARTGTGTDACAGTVAAAGSPPLGNGNTAATAAATAAAPANGTGTASEVPGAATESQREPLEGVLSILDFADAGHGDPLYDLVIVLGGCFALDAQLMRACWEGYRQLVNVRTEWPVKQVEAGMQGMSTNAGVRDMDSVLGAGGEARERRCLSYAAMCYCMLLEEDLVLERATHKLPGVQEVAMAQGLPGLQRMLWGFLDE